MDGTALKPIELDSDQEGRAEMRNTRIATNKRLREEAAAAQELEEQRKAEAAAAKKESRAANVVIRLTKAQQKKIDEEKIAKMKKASVTQRKAQKTTCSQWIAYNKVEAAWLCRKANAEHILTNKMLGLPVSHRPSRSQHVEEEEEEQIEDVFDYDQEDSGDDEEDTIVVARVTRKHLRSSGSTSDNPTPRKKKAGTTSPVNVTTRTSPRFTKSASPKHVAIGEAPVTDETLASPRMNMNMAELDAALVHRNLSRPSREETLEQVVARLEMEDKLSTVDTLKMVLEGHGLSVSGKKSALIERLRVYEGEEKERIV